MVWKSSSAPPAKLHLHIPAAASKAHQDPLALLAAMGTVETPEAEETMAVLDPMPGKERTSGPTPHSASAMPCLDLWDLLDHEANPDLRETRELMASMAPLDRKVHLDLKDHPDPRDHKDPRDLLDLLVHCPQLHLHQRDPLDLKVALVLRDLVESKDELETMGARDLLDHKESLDHSVALDHKDVKDLPDLVDHLDSQETATTALASKNKFYDKKEMLYIGLSMSFSLLQKFQYYLVPMQ